MREAAARWTLIAYFFLSTLFIIIFASAINLDIVDGALAGAKLFGKEVEMGSNEISIEKLVLGFESGFSGVPLRLLHVPGDLRHGASRAAHAGERDDRPLSGAAGVTRAACCSRATWPD